MTYLALVRHGESTFNEQGRFTGWHDVLLTSKGEEQARLAAKKIKKIKFALAFTSQLTRAKDSLKIILKEIHQEEIPVQYDHALNERDYGDLTGKTHAEVIAQYGQEQFDLWHRSWDTRPPHGESMQDTAKRVNRYFEDMIKPELLQGKNVLIVASSNSLRGLKKELNHLTETQGAALETPTGAAGIYNVEGGKITEDLKPSA